MSDNKVKKSDKEWQEILSPERYLILRKAGTEPPFSGLYQKSRDSGIYHCGGCDAELFDSKDQFDSGCGWPAFAKAIHPDAIIKRSDSSHGMQRDEILCARCGGHLGHVFNDGPIQLGGQRFCINSVALELHDQEE